MGLISAINLSKLAEGGICAAAVYRLPRYGYTLANVFLSLFQNLDAESRIGKHYILLADNLKDRLIGTCEDVNDIMSSYTVMLNECNELEELVKQEPDHAVDESTTINVGFELSELRQTLYAVQDAAKNIEGDDYFAQRYRMILTNVESKLRDARKDVFGTGGTK